MKIQEFDSIWYVQLYMYAAKPGVPDDRDSDLDSANTEDQQTSTSGAPVPQVTRRQSRFQDSSGMISTLWNDDL